MTFMPNTFQNKNELFLRAVRPPEEFPNFWKDGRLSSAAFKDNKGLSVDRTAERKPEIAAKLMSEKYQGQIFGVSVGDCIEKKIHMCSLPLIDNPYHCELHGSPDKISLSQAQAKALAQRAILITY